MDDVTKRVVEAWRDFFNSGVGKGMTSEQCRRVLETTAALHRRDGREDIAKAVEALIDEVTA